MDVSIERECSALGGLFQQIITDMKVLISETLRVFLNNLLLLLFRLCLTISHQPHRSSFGCDALHWWRLCFILKPALHFFCSTFLDNCILLIDVCFDVVEVDDSRLNRAGLNWDVKRARENVFNIELL